MVQERPTPANWWDHENLDNAETGLHDHAMYRKFGYGRGAAQMSVDIRMGRVDRATALRWVDKHDGIFPWLYAGVTFEHVLERVGLTQERACELLDHFTNWSLFAGNHGRRPLLKAA